MTGGENANQKSHSGDRKGMEDSSQVSMEVSPSWMMLLIVGRMAMMNPNSAILVWARRLPTLCVRISYGADVCVQSGIPIQLYIAEWIMTVAGGGLYIYI